MEDKIQFINNDVLNYMKEPIVLLCIVFAVILIMAAVFVHRELKKK